MKNEVGKKREIDLPMAHCLKGQMPTSGKQTAVPNVILVTRKETLYIFFSSQCHFKIISKWLLNLLWPFLRFLIIISIDNFDILAWLIRI